MECCGNAKFSRRQEQTRIRLNILVVINLLEVVTGARENRINLEVETRESENKVESFGNDNTEYITEGRDNAEML